MNLTHYSLSPHSSHSPHSPQGGKWVSGSAESSESAPSAPSADRSRRRLADAYRRAGFTPRVECGLAQTVTPSAQDQRTSTPTHVAVNARTYGATVTPLSRSTTPRYQRRSDGLSWWVGLDRAQLAAKIMAIDAARHRAERQVIDAYLLAHAIERHDCPTTTPGGGSDVWIQR